jgi:hypothetical protein
MRSLPTILLVLSLPAGALAYAIAANVIQDLPLPDGAQLLGLLVPLFIAGLVMMPFLIPFFDRKAREDLAAYRRSQEFTTQDGESPDAGDPGAKDR